MENFTHLLNSTEFEFDGNTPTYSEMNDGDIILCHSLLFFDIL